MIAHEGDSRLGCGVISFPESTDDAIAVGVEDLLAIFLGEGLTLFGPLSLHLVRPSIRTGL